MELETEERATVTEVIWDQNMCCLTLRDPSFRMKITLGVFLIRSLVHVKRFGMSPEQILIDFEIMGSE